MPLRYLAEFRPQAWLNDHAIDVDPEGPTTFDVTSHVRKGATKQQRRSALEGKELDLDWLRDSDTAPAWVRDWTGPFECELTIGRVPPEHLQSDDLPAEVRRLVSAWRAFVAAVAQARQAAANIRELEQSEEDYLSAFEWTGARSDEVARTVKRMITKLGHIASKAFAPAGQELSVDVGPLLAPLRDAEHALRERDDPWPQIARAIDAQWATFDPAQAWRSLRDRYANTAMVHASQQTIDAFKCAFYRRGSHLFATRGRGHALLEIQCYLYEDGEITPTSREDLYRGLDALARMLRIALPGHAPAEDLANGLVTLARGLDTSRKLVSRQRFPLPAGAFAVTFKAKVEIHLPQEFAEAIALRLSDDLARAA